MRINSAVAMEFLGSLVLTVAIVGSGNSDE